MRPMNDGVGSQSHAATHGFLFADLRGYTRLVDTRGAVGASLLLGRYRTIIREVVARHGGAEIKLKGTASTSSSRRPRRPSLRSRHPRRLQKADGRRRSHRGWSRHPRRGVGGARRRLRRLGGQHCRSDMRRRRRWGAPGVGNDPRADPLDRGGPVRVRWSPPAQGPGRTGRAVQGRARWRLEFAPRRPRQAVSAARPVLWLIVAAVVIAVIATGVLAAMLWRLSSGPSVASSSAGPTASPGPPEGQLAASPSMPIERLPPGGLVQPGTYAPNRNRDVASVTVAEPDWILAANSEDLLFFEKLGVGGVGPARISVVYTGPCRDDPTRLIGDRPGDLIEWVQSTPQLEASQPRSVTDLGRSGIAIEATVRPHPGDACEGGSPPSAYLWGVSGGSWSPNVGTRILFEALDDGPRTLTVVFAAADAGALRTLEVGPGRDLLKSIVLRP